VKTPNSNDSPAFRHITLRLDQPTLQALLRRAEANERTLSQEIRFSLREHLSTER
jgi:hypothetical protein